MIQVLVVIQQASLLLRVQHHHWNNPLVDVLDNKSTLKNRIYLNRQKRDSPIIILEMMNNSIIPTAKDFLIRLFPINEMQQDALNFTVWIKITELMVGGSTFFIC
jgi:hypothetical protein